MTDPITASPTKIQMIDISLIRPNSYNPNRLTKQQRRELLAEINHLGTLPHPLILRPITPADDGKQYEIVDGEHRYDIALEVGYEQVPCVVLDVDEFEAMRQTFKRNRGGRDDKVKLGRMYASMRAARGLTRRKLAKEICVPESSIRAAEDYARAADLRSACAPDTADSDITKLKHAQVLMYLALKGSLRDKWLDAGADLRAFDLQRGMMWEVLVHLFVEFEFSDFVADRDEFYDSLDRLAKLAVWLDKHRGIANIVGYAHAAAQRGLDVRVMDALPYRRQGGELVVAIELADWDAALAAVSGTAVSPYEELLGAQAAVRTALTAAGVDLATVLGPVEAEAVSVVSKAAGFIQEASQFLTLHQQRWLAEIDGNCGSEERELVLQAKELTCRQLEAEGKVPPNRLEAVYALHRAHVQRPEQMLESTDEEDVVAAVANHLAASTLLSGTVDGRPAAEVLRERLDTFVPYPELRLLVAALSKQPLSPDAGQRWLADVQQELAAG